MYEQNIMNFSTDVCPTKDITDMACIKKCNGDTPSNELILIFGLTKKATTVHDTLLQWLFRCLDTISDKVFVRHFYTWNIISQIIDNDYVDGDDKDATIKNSIVVAIHLDDDSYMSYDDTEMTILPYRYNPSLTLYPQEIMQCLINEPVFVNRIGVSAISSDVMMQWWAEMISTEPDYLAGGGKGYKVHPMWTKVADDHKSDDHESDTKWGDWTTVRERSFNFGWKGYEQYLSDRFGLQYIQKT